MSGGAVSPRTKMINLLYVVYIGMIAMNVSADVLKGYAVVEEGLMKSIATSNEQNTELFAKLTAIYAMTPGKAQKPHDKAKELREKT